MNIKQKLSSFNSNEPILHIFREGLFAKMYNESAYLFEQNVRAYKVKVIESRQGRYYSLGFPMSRLEETLLPLGEYEINKVDSDYITCSASKLHFDKSEYAEWCNKIDKTFDTNGLSSINSAKLSINSAADENIPIINNSNILERIAISSDSNLEIRTILGDIQRFRIDNSTPTDCMLFLQSIQNRIYGAISESTSI